MKALVLSGGGAKGAYQAGVLSMLADKGISFDVVAGVSVGALNGVMVAQDRTEDMVQVWETVKEKDVFTKHSWPRIVLNNLSGGQSLYSLSPLKNILSGCTDLALLQKRFYCGVTSLVDGKYTSLTNEDFESSEQLQDAVYASSIQPILWQSINLEVRNRVIEGAVDGGIRNVTPLADVIREMPDEIFIITCGKGDIKPYHPRNIIEVASRTFLDIFLSEIMQNDIRQLLKLNALVLQAEREGVTLRKSDGTGLKYFKVTLIQPPHNLGSSIDFSKTKDHFKLGLNEKINSPLTLC